jgi:ribosome recycling factor
MKNYTVHIFPIVRVTVPNVEAESQTDAIKKVDQLIDSGKIDLRAMLDGADREYAEDLDGYHVDEVGDTEYKNSTWYDKEGRPL